MINKDANPVEWTMLSYGLSDAHEHLGDLIKKFENHPNLDDAELAVYLGHIYAHLNRFWNWRNMTREINESEWEAASEFPKDIRPVG